MQIFSNRFSVCFHHDFVKNRIKYFFYFREPFPVAKQIQPAKILGLISRGLAVNCNTLSINQIVDNIIVGFFLPEIHVALFELLDSLILM